MSDGDGRSDPPDANAEPAESVDGWPVELRGVTESVVATRGPNDRWNFAALGLRVVDVDEPDATADADADAGAGRAGDAESATALDAVRATTWGDTRTRRNFHRRGGGVVQFTTDPRDFVDAALTVREAASPLLDSADAWARVEATEVGADDAGGTHREHWALRPVESAVRRRRVPTINRGFAAVVEATVAASRLDVDAHDTETLLDRLAYFAETVEACGGPRDREAFARIDEATGWRETRNESF